MTWHSDETFQLLFGIQRSVRYHDRRIAYFESLHRTTSVLTIVMSGVVITGLLGPPDPPVVKVIAAIAALFGAFDLVVGFSRRAGEHRDLKRRYVALEQRMALAGTDDSPAKVRADRLAIEAEEPPVYRALDGLCHNEMLISHGFSKLVPDDLKHFRTIPSHKRWTASVYRWPDLADTTRPPPSTSGAA